MIRVIDDFVIDSDGTQFICGKLGHAVSKKDKTPYDYVKNPSYYTNFSGALRGISRRLRLEAIKDTNGDMKAACEAIKRCDERMIEAISQFDEPKVEAHD